MGLACYYRRFIQGFSAIAVLSGTKFNWDNTCEKASQELKAKLITAPVISFPNLNDRFYLLTDASVIWLGYALIQIFQGKEHPILYGEDSSQNKK